MGELFLFGEKDEAKKKNWGGTDDEFAQVG
jgi:hypothetical protein